jgi:cobaltochelatase CobS
MTIILHTLDTDRIAAAVKALGLPDTRPDIDSSNRHHVRSVLAGLGFPSHTFNAAPLAELRAAYYSLATDGFGLCNFLFEIDSRISSETMLQNLEDLRTRYAAAGVCGTVFELTRTNYEAARPQAALPLPAPAPQATAPTPDMQAAIAQLIAAAQAAATPAAAPLDEARIIQLIKENAAATVVRIVTDNTAREIPTGLHHHALADLIKVLQAVAPNRRNVYIVGGAGSGKTTLAEQVAKTFELPFYFNGAIDSEYKLIGFIDAAGKYQSTAFRKAYENGGVYLFDEIDSSSASALLALNAALANGHMDFPDGAVKRHKDFIALAAANTVGTGATRTYCGRNQLDASSIDRFIFIDAGYDEKLERTLAGNDEWTNMVLKYRAAADRLKIRHIISPRASIMGAELLAGGLDRAKVEQMIIWKGLDADSIAKIKNAA